MVVGAESNVGTGGGAAFVVDVCSGWREVLACGEEACSREEELGLAGVPEGCVRLFVGLSAFVSPNVLRVDARKDFECSSCAKYDVLVR